MSKYIVSLGAGKDQLNLIRAIQACGFKCLAFDRDPMAAGADEADAFMAISNRDYETIAAEIGPMEIAAVIAAGSEVPDVMAILSHRLGTPCFSVATGLLMKDKLLYKKVLKAAGVPHTEAYPVYAGSVKALFDQLKYEVVIKPQRGSGSKGVSLMLHNPMELEVAYSNALEVCPDVIMEKYGRGPQVSSESLIWDGRILTPAFADRFYESFGKEVGGSMPSVHLDRKPEAEKIIADAAKALGITRGTLKCDLVLTNDGWKIIECTPRLSGGPLVKLAEKSIGWNYFDMAVEMVTGTAHRGWLDETDYVNVAMDMNGNELDWEETRKYVE